MRDPFRLRSNDEIMKETKDKLAREANLAKLKSNAVSLLSFPEAEKYREDLQQATRDMVKLMIENNNPDPVEYAFFCKCCLAKLGVMYEILDNIMIETQ